MDSSPSHPQLASAIEHHKANRFTAAEIMYRQLLSVNPNDAKLLHLLGVLCQQTGRPKLAIQSMQHAISLQPDFPVALNNLSVSLLEVGRPTNAVTACQRAIALHPNYAAAYLNLGNALRETGQLNASIIAYRTAMKLAPPSAVALCRLSAVLHDLGDFDESIAAAKQAIAIDPSHAPAHQHLGHALKGAGQIDEALQSYDAAIALRPGDAAMHSHRIFSLQFSPRFDAMAIRRELAEWNRRHARVLPSPLPHQNDRSPDRPLRIGYVAPSFCAHSVSFFFLPLLRDHDGAQFEIYCYSDVVCPDAITAEMRSHADYWNSIVGMSDEEVVALIRDHRIDILIDLHLHMARNRLAVFARKPAPVQVTALGYPGSTGLETIDYRLTDPQLDPTGTDSFYSERSIRLPETFWCYGPMNDDVPVNELPALDRDEITFGCLNHFYKMNDGVIDLFARVLIEIPNSRLIMLCGFASGQSRARSIFQRAGVDSSRIEFVKQQPRADYLRTYHRIDVSLDVFPYNGHTTSLDSLWMGVPMISLIGRTVVGRAGLSILTNLQLENLVADSPAAYVRIASELTADRQALNDLRTTLRSRMLASPLMDAPRFAHHVESACRQMWRAWCNSEQTPPAPN